MLTAEQLKKICPTLNDDRAVAISGLMNVVCLKYDINTPLRLQAFLAQVAHESGEFSIKTESMNYSTPERIVAIWPSRFNLTGEGKLNAHDYIHNAEKLGNQVYAGRMGNGAPETGDGFRYRGGGYLQLTGKESYQRYADYIKKDVGETANLVRSTDEFALDSACWEFVIDKRLNDEADAQDFITITKRINGGTIGLTERLGYYKLAKQIIV
jgi:putative chitinase